MLGVGTGGGIGGFSASGKVNMGGVPGRSNMEGLVKVDFVAVNVKVYDWAVGWWGHMS